MSEDLRDPTWSPVVPFSDPFDRNLAAHGPGALFTIGHKGQLRLALNRSRDQGKRAADDRPKRPCHCLFRDRATGFVQYVLATTPALCQAHPRADIREYPDQPSALAALASLGRPPVADTLPAPGDAAPTPSR
jgi:hypothetical protein